MYTPIQNSSEFVYYYSIARELVCDKLAPTAEQFCRFSGEQDAGEQLHAKAEHLVGRVSRSTSRAEDEISAEYEQLQKLNTAPNKTAKTARLVQDYAANEFPARLIAIADLKFRLMQVQTSMKHKMLIPSFGADKTFRELERQRFLQQHRRTASNDQQPPLTDEEMEASLHAIETCEDGPAFLQLCRAGVEAAIVELLATGRHREALDACLHVLPAVDKTHIHELTFRSLLVESLQIVVGHVDQTSRTAKAVGSSAPSSQPSSSAASSPAAAAAAAASVPQHHQQQQAQPHQEEGGEETVAHHPKKHKPPFPVPSSSSTAEGGVAVPVNNNDADADDALPRYDPSMTDAQVYELLRKFYAVYVPDYVESVSYLCEQHRGEYEKLFRLVAEKYGAVVKLKRQQQAAAAAAAAAQESKATATATPALAATRTDAADGVVAVDATKPTVESGAGGSCALQ